MGKRYGWTNWKGGNDFWFRAKSKLDGSSDSYSLPPLTEERRKELVRVVRDEAEHARVAVRNIRRDAISDYRELLKEKEISEDETHRAEENIHKITDQHIGLIDKSLSDKENSLLEI